MPDDVDLRPAASCRACHSIEFRPLIVLERSGKPPWVQPHEGFVYRHVVVFLCLACFCAQLETWDHDCFVMAEDEPWDVYDWYVIDAGDALRLRVLLGTCPAPLRPECECAVHTALRVARASSRRIRRASNCAGRLGAWLEVKLRREGAFVVARVADSFGDVRGLVLGRQDRGPRLARSGARRPLPVREAAVGLTREQDWLSDLVWALCIVAAAATISAWLIL